MQLKLLKSKIQEVVVTESSLDYPGSIGLPNKLMKASKILPFEEVFVHNKTRGARIQTYAIPNGSENIVTLNGAAAHHFERGDQIHILTYAYVGNSETNTHQPTLVRCNPDNQITTTSAYSFVDQMETFLP